MRLCYNCVASFPSLFHLTTQQRLDVLHITNWHDTSGWYEDGKKAQRRETSGSKGLTKIPLSLYITYRSICKLVGRRDKGFITLVTCLCLLEVDCQIHVCKVLSGLRRGSIDPCKGCVRDYEQQVVSQLVNHPDRVIYKSGDAASMRPRIVVLNRAGLTPSPECRPRTANPRLRDCRWVGSAQTPAWARARTPTAAATVRRLCCRSPGWSAWCR